MFHLTRHAPLLLDKGILIWYNMSKLANLSILKRIGWLPKALVRHKRKTTLGRFWMMLPAIRLDTLSNAAVFHKPLYSALMILPTF